MRKVFCVSISFSLILAVGISLRAASSAPAAPASPAEDGTMPALAAIAGQGMMTDESYTDLEQLSDYIGARVTGSPQAAKAVDWGIARMKAIGLENVHAEKWQISRGWTRVSASAELLAPVQRPLLVDSMGWVGSTPAGGVEAEVVPVNLLQADDEMKNNAGNWTGKILLILRKGAAPTGPAARGLFLKFGDVLKKAEAVHAAAVIGGQGGALAQGMRLTHTGELGYNAYFDIPVVSMIAEDQ
ncbi:MAG TPA: hypothetical protein VFY05_10855, partial [Candidatus Angelobacter sp.]|nr:hypothetical protein [Candidatus Angelobacter sp.]